MDKGACISVFSCFSDTKSLINLYAASPHCVIQFIKARDLEKLGEEIIPLNDRLNIIKLRIQNGEVDDIDYFTFPMHHLWNYVDQEQDGQRWEFSRQAYRDSKKRMIAALIRYGKLYKLGYCKFPKAIGLLNKVRQDVKVLDLEDDYNKLKE